MFIYSHFVLLQYHFVPILGCTVQPAQSLNSTEVENSVKNFLQNKEMGLFHQIKNMFRVQGISVIMEITMFSLGVIS